MRRLLLLCFNIAFIEWTDSQTAGGRMLGPMLRRPRLSSDPGFQVNRITPTGILTNNRPAIPIGLLENSIFSGVSVHNDGQSPDSNLRQTAHFDLNNQPALPRMFRTIHSSSGSTVSETATGGQQLPSSAHFDWPGRHGNMGSEPVLHQQAQVTLGGATIVDISPGMDILQQESLLVDIPATPNLADFPSGSHFDSPGEHGNTASVTALHVPDQTIGAPSVTRPGHPATPAGASGLSPGPADFPLGTHVDLPREHGNTASEPVLHIPDQAIGAPLAIPPGHPATPAGPSGLSPGPADFPLGTHVDLPGEHGNTASEPVLHVPDQAIGAPSAIPPGHPATPAGASGLSPDLADLPSGTHVDLPGEHGNTASEPVLHIPDQAIGAPSAIPPGHPATPAGASGLSPDLADFPPGTHVDLPGEHGNTASEPVLHIPDQAIGAPSAIPPGHPATPAGASGLSPDLADFPPGTHVDLPGEHGNTASEPVLHVPDQAIGAPSAIPPGHPATPAGAFGLSPDLADFPPGTHVDLPREHGNTASDPVLHIPDQAIGAPSATPPGHSATGASRVSLSMADFAPGTRRPGGSTHSRGRFGNQGSGPVINIPDFPHDISVDQSLPATAHGIRSHVPSLSSVLSGQPGSIVPPIATPTTGALHGLSGGGFSGVGLADVPPGTHVDLPGEHGNIASDPVLHISDQALWAQQPDSPPGHSSTPVGAFGVSPGLADFPPGTHVDLPREHGNTASDPVLHIVDQAIGAPPATPQGHPATQAGMFGVSPGLADFPRGTHIDLPREHGNTASDSVLHIPDQALGAPSVTRPGHSATPAVAFGVSPGLADFQRGTHVDLPSEHGNTASVPALHIPDQAIGAPPATPQGNPATQAGMFGVSPGLADFPRGTHVDLPREHGNTASDSVLHIPDQALGAPSATRPGHSATSAGAFGVSPGLADFPRGTHVDRPSEHGNTASVPALHIPDQAIGTPFATPPGHTATHPGASGVSLSMADFAPGTHRPGGSTHSRGRFGNQGSGPVINIPDFPVFSGQPGIIVPSIATPTTGALPGLSGGGFSGVGGGGSYPRRLSRGWRRRMEPRSQSVGQIIDIFGSPQPQPPRGTAVIVRNPLRSDPISSVRRIGSRFGLETVVINGPARRGPPSFPRGRGLGWGRQTSGMPGRRTGQRRLPLINSVFRTVRRVLSPARGMRMGAPTSTRANLMGALRRIIPGRV